MSAHITCARCSGAHENWPANDGLGHLCQECWEAQCSREWWRLVDLLPLLSGEGE